MSSYSFDPVVLERAQNLQGALWGMKDLLEKTTVIGECKFLAVPPALKTFIPEILHPSILIRHEYELAITAITNVSSKEYNKFVITGQPGIGKSTFLAYLLFHRLVNQQPTAIQLENEGYYLFKTGGPAYHAPIAPLAPEVWALMDSGIRNATTPCPGLTSSQGVLIQATSPQPIRWKQWRKQVNARLYIMDLWSLQEIASFANRFGYDEKQALRLADLYGPNIRNIQRLLVEPQSEEAFCTYLNNRIKKIAPQLADIISEIPAVTFDDSEVASDVIFIAPKPARPIRDMAVASIPSQYIAYLIQSAISRRHITEQHAFFSSLSSHPSSRAAAGWMYENFVHARLSAVRDGDHPVVATFLRTGQTHDVPAVTNVLLGSQTYLKDGSVPFYWRPGQPNYSGIDAVIHTDNAVWLIQATISNAHRSTSGGALKVWNEVPAASKTLSWYLLFVGPHSATLRGLATTEQGRFRPSSTGRTTKRKEQDSPPFPSELSNITICYSELGLDANYDAAMLVMLQQIPEKRITFPPFEEPTQSDELAMAMEVE